MSLRETEEEEEVGLCSALRTRREDAWRLLARERREGGREGGRGGVLVAGCITEANSLDYITPRANRFIDT
jgi:hypothetical protein